MGYEKPKNYNEVKDRILEFRDKHPEGSLQAGPVEWVRDEQGKILGLTIRAEAYRSPDDPRPGVGTAFEFYPGKTPYTKGSEVQNAETSAWGRALIAVGAADATQGIASADEVRRSGGNTQAARSGPSVASLESLFKAKGIPGDDVRDKVRDLGYTGLSKVDSVGDLEVLRVWGESWGSE